MIKDLWDHQKPLSPRVLGPAMTVLSWLLVGMAGVFLLAAIGSLATFKVFTALVQIVIGVGAPLAIWLVARMLADMVALMNQSQQRLSEMAASLAALQRPAGQPSASGEGQYARTPQNAG